MSLEQSVSERNYNPARLLDKLIDMLWVENDADLARFLGVSRPVISKVRNRKQPVGASLLIRMHEVSELSISDLRSLMGDRRVNFRISDRQVKPMRTGAVLNRTVGEDVVS